LVALQEKPRCERGFSVQAAPLGHLCRYIIRPSIATQRLSVDCQGDVVHRYKQPFRSVSLSKEVHLAELGTRRLENTSKITSALQRKAE